jgi:hypothetical protein
MARWPDFSIVEPKPKCNLKPRVGISYFRRYFLMLTCKFVLLRSYSSAWLGAQIIQAFPEGRNVITAPTMADAQPPTNSHNVLFVGDPVNARETPELNESEALNPMQIKMIPTTNSAIPIPFCIIILFFAAGHSKCQRRFL